MANLQQDIVELRRRRVAALRMRHFTHEEIWQQLAMPFLPAAPGETPRPNPSYITNPKTGKPYDRSTITRDLEALRLEWKAERIQDTDTLQADRLRELKEVKRTAWARNDVKAIISSIELECKILGLLATNSVKLSFDWKDEMRNAGIDPEQAAEAAAAVIRQGLINNESEE